MSPPRVLPKRIVDGYKHTERALPWAALLSLACVALWLWRSGFSHVSDDDFARTVIAQEWSASLRGLDFSRELLAPRDQRWLRVLDPSGTSWLPLPFWLTGAAMTVFGRSLEVARLCQLALVLLAVASLWRVLRKLALGPVVAALIVLFGFLHPEVLWLSISQSPDAWTALLIATALLSLALPKPDAPAALGLLAATLSRYEAWPVAAVFALRYAAVALANRRGPGWARSGWLALAPLAGPGLWLLHNQLAHDGALHFLGRVARYRQQHEAPNDWQRWAHVPAASLELFGALELFAIAGGALALLLCGARRMRSTTAPQHYTGRPSDSRFWLPLLGAAALWLFLLAGSLGDGAPTHHPERAQLALVWVSGVPLVIGGARLLTAVNHRFTSKGGATLTALIAFVSVLQLPERWQQLLDWPGRGDESRDAALAQGMAARAHTHGFTLRTCRYEHLALLAAYQAPERVQLSAREDTGERCQLQVLPR